MENPGVRPILIHVERLVCLTDRGHPTSTLTVTLELMAFELLNFKIKSKEEFEKELIGFHLNEILNH